MFDRPIEQLWDGHIAVIINQCATAPMYAPERRLIRIIHTLGGCGGTILSRCVGVLPDVALLSEVNPGSVNLFPRFHPLFQDSAWLHLLDAAQSEYFSKKDLGMVDTFRELVGAFHDRATASGRHLVIRDYNYVDFVGVPFLLTPPGSLMLYPALPLSISTVAVAFVRHPIDQWLSLCKHWQVRDALTPAAFCEAYDAFLIALGTTRVYRYEDFVRNPATELRAMCRDLDLPFEASFIERFHHFDSVTGDMTRLRDRRISAPARSERFTEVRKEFRASHSFGKILLATGYAE